MADQDDLLEPELLHHGGHVLAERLDRPLLASGSRLTVSREIDGDHPVTRREVAQLGIPIRPIARPAVHEHQSRPAHATCGVADRYAVSGEDLRR
jgi:hypothetical protein